MNEGAEPTIKGLFVNSHIKAFQRERGPEGVAELARRTGLSLRYATTDDVPVSQEIAILESVVELTSSVPLPDEERQEEAGRLHLRNFATTTMWSLLEQLIGRNLKFLFMQSSWIGAWVFTGITFSSEDLGGNSVRINMSHSVYPRRHFKGFFEQWMHELGVEGVVEVSELVPGHHTYTIKWH